MDEQGIEVCNLPLLPVVWRERVMVIVGFVEFLVEAAEEGGRLRWAEIGQMPVKALEMLLGGFVEEAAVISFSELGFEAALHEEVRPVIAGGVVLGKAAHVIVFVKAELRSGNRKRSNSVGPTEGNRKAGESPRVRSQRC